MGDVIKKEMQDLVMSMQSDRVMVNNKVDLLRTEAEEDIQEELANELIERIMEIVEAEATIGTDEDEIGSYPVAEIDTPNTREIIRGMILDEYRLEKQ